IVEQGAPQTLFRDAAHPYTQALLDAVPRMEPRQPGIQRSRTQQVEPRVQLPGACPYAHRCPHAQELCDIRRPELTPLAGAGHRVACHFPQNQTTAKSTPGDTAGAKA
ncbi:MAG: oligopeptide/dipeptide ABC transporter ATP-binding protein, partial [Betaproteobacteria bacterium]